MRHPTKLVLAATAATVALSACGGSGSADSAAPPPATGGSAPAATPVTAWGIITGFGSVFVNGVRYDTSAAEIEFEDEGRKTEDDLRLGMKVRVDATREGAERRADRVRFDEDLRGPVSDVFPAASDPRLGTFSVASQLVTVDANSVFDDDVGDANQDGSIDIRDLDPDLGPVVVEVSGFPTEDGVLATRVDREDTAGATRQTENEVEVQGFVAELDETAGRFRIRGLAISFGLEDLDSQDFPEGNLRNDIFVEVKGALLSSGSVDATRIEREDDLLEDDQRRGEFEIEGVLQAIDTGSDPDTVTVNGLTIAVDDAGRLAGSEGRLVEIKGTFDADGVLVINGDDTGVQFEMENTLRTQDRVETVGVESFTTRLGLEIKPTGNSRIEDDLADDGDRLTPADFLSRLVSGDFIEARGYQEAGGVTWTRVERGDDHDMTCRLRGPVEAGSIDDPRFVIQGITIDTSRITSPSDFRDANEIGIGREEFFRRLSAGAIVEAHSVETGDGCSGGLLIAAEVAFEAGDDVASNGSVELDAEGNAILIED